MLKTKPVYHVYMYSARACVRAKDPSLLFVLPQFQGNATGKATDKWIQAARQDKAVVGRQSTRKYDNVPLLFSLSLSHRGGVALGRALGRAMREKKTACDVVTDVRRAAAFQKVRKNIRSGACAAEISSESDLPL